MVKILGGVGVPFFLCVRFCCLDLVGKQGVERTMKEVSASVVAEVKAVEAELYNNIGEARVAFGIKTSK